MKTIFASACIAFALPAAALAASAIRFERPIWFIFQSDSGIDEPLNTVVRDRQAWEALWVRLHARRGPFNPAPPIDFSKRMVLVTALGQLPTGGSSVRIASVAHGRNQITATVVRRSSCIATAAFTYPTDLVVAPASPKPVRWRFRNTPVRC